MMILQLLLTIKDNRSYNKWGNFDISLNAQKNRLSLQDKETLFVPELKPAVNVIVGSEKLLF